MNLEKVLNLEPLTSKSIRVAVVDAHPVVRLGLRAILEDTSNFTVVVDAASASSVIDSVRRDAVDIVILDLSMYRRGGLEALATIKLRAPRLPVLVFSAYPVALYADTVARLGADGYLNKCCHPSDVVDAVARLARPGTPDEMTLPSIHLLDPMDVRIDACAALHHQLNAREFQIFLRLANGERVSSIGKSLHLSAATVSVYRTRLTRKLSVKSNAELTRYAVHHSLL